MLRLPTFVVRVLLVALGASLLPQIARAQCFEWASGFGPAGTDAPVETQVVFDDGSGPALYLGGSFSAAGSVSSGPIVRWDGSSLAAAGLGIQGVVDALAVFDAGSGPQLYAGGLFQLNGTPVNVARWSGSAWTALDSGVNGRVRALTVHDDGTGPALIIGGDFSRANNFPINTVLNHVGRWTGSAWDSLWTGVGSWQSQSEFVYALSSYDDGSGAGPQLYAGGYYDNVAGNTQHAIARWDGTDWRSVGTGLAASSMVQDMVVYDDGSGAAPRLALVGQLKPVGQAAFLPLALWDGSSWSVPSGFTAGDIAYAACMHDDGSGAALYLGGRLGVGGPSSSRIVRKSGSVLTTITNSMDLNVLSLGSFDDGTGARLIAGGYFGRIDGLDMLHCASWNGSAWSAIAGGNGLPGRPHAFALFDDGSGGGADLYAGGESIYPASTGGRVSHWDGHAWSRVGADFSGPVRALASFDDGSGSKLYAAGYSSQTPMFCSAWNGATWQPLPAPPLPVFSLTVHDDQLGGGPALYAGVLNLDPFNSAPNLVWRWNAGAWVPLGNPGMQATALCTFDDGQGPALFAGGLFDFGHVMRWNGAAWSLVGSSTTWATVSALAVFDDGSGPALYAGGEFTNMGGVPAKSIARWNGSAWSTVGAGFGPGTVAVRALTVFDEGFGAGAYLVAGGRFSASAATPLANVASWNGSSWQPFASGLSGSAYSGSPAEVYALSTFDDGLGSGRDLYAAGDFLAAGGKPASFVAKWEGCGGMGTPFCFGDGSLALGCPCANSGAVGSGCANSAVAAGARLSGSGGVQPDTLVLTAQGLLPSAPALFLQGDALLANGAPFGDGIRCAGGHLLRLAVKVAVSGATSYPAAGDLPISARAAALGHPIPGSASRFYQAYYRDPAPGFCPAPAGATWNITSGLRIVW